MSPSTKLALVIVSASHAYASYFGGIGVGTFVDSSGNLICPPGTTLGAGLTWCCPDGTQFDTLQDQSVLCCPSSADCTNDLLNSGLQCADPSMTMFKRGGFLLCCPAGYIVDVARNCVNTGSADFYTSTAQSASLTIDSSSPSAAPPSVSAGPTDSASPSKIASGSPSVTPIVDPTGTVILGGGINSTSSKTGSSKTSTSVSTSTSHAAAANLAGGVGGGLGGLLAVLGMYLV